MIQLSHSSLCSMLYASPMEWPGNQMRAKYTDTKSHQQNHRPHPHTFHSLSICHGNAIYRFACFLHRRHRARYVLSGRIDFDCYGNHTDVCVCVCMHALEWSSLLDVAPSMNAYRRHCLSFTVNITDSGCGNRQRQHTAQKKNGDLCINKL